MKILKLLGIQPSGLEFQGVLAVLRRPGNYRKLTSSDVLVPVLVLVLAVLVHKILKNLRPRTSLSPSLPSLGVLVDWVVKYTVLKSKIYGP